MAPHSSFPGVPGWAVGPAGFAFPATMDASSRGLLQGLEPPFAPAFGSYVPAPFLPAGPLSYPGVFPGGEVFPGPFMSPTSYTRASGPPHPREMPRHNEMPQAPAPPISREADAESLQDRLEGLALNPKAKEFVPPGSTEGLEGARQQGHKFGKQANGSLQNKAGGTGKRKLAMQKQLSLKVRRTVYICDIDQSVTEEELAEIFYDCGKVQDCRVCGDPNSAMRFAFIEFEEEEAVPKALAKAGMKIGPFSLRILPSKTAIVPVNNTYLPRTEEERELCSRTIYVANIDKRADKRDVKAFFTNICGAVTKLRLLGDFHHMTRIAFVEFEEADSANRALDISGALLGMLPLRISPSKTPVRSSPTDIQEHSNSEQRPRRRPNGPSGGQKIPLSSSGTLTDEASTAS